MVLSMLLLLPWFFADFVKVKKKKKKNRCNIYKTYINLQFFFQDPPVFYQEKKNIFLHFELHTFYGDVLTLKNAEIRGEVLFDSTTEYRYLRS